MQLRVLTFNIQHCRSFLEKDRERIDFALFADTIRCFDPDVVGLNEVRGEGESPQYRAQAKLLAELLGYHDYFAPAIHVPKGGPYGNAILSKLPLEHPETVMIPDPVRDPARSFYETRCIAKAFLPVAGGLTLLVTHFGLQPEEAKNAVDTVCSEVQKSAFPVVLTGDFNLKPDSPLLQPIRALLADTADAFTRPLLSFPSDAPREKIDYIFTSRQIKTVFATVPQMIVSDHRPYLSVLELPD